MASTVKTVSEYMKNKNDEEWQQENTLNLPIKVLYSGFDPSCNYYSK